MSINGSRRVNWQKNSYGPAAYPAPPGRVTVPITVAKRIGQQSWRSLYDTQSDR
jgi:hypothetical protein